MSFGKIWDGMYKGSMFGAGLEVMAVWPYILACADKNHRIELNPNYVAALIGCSPDDVEKAIEFLSSPDPKSRAKEYDGARIVREGEYMYYVPNRRFYCEMQNDTKIQAQRRIRKRKQRFFESNPDATEEQFYRDDYSKYMADYRAAERPVTGLSPHVDVDVDVDVDNSNSSVISNTEVSTCNNSNTVVPSRKAVAKNPPTVEEVFQHIQDKGYKGNEKALALAEQIVEHHNNGGQWRTGAGKPIYVWKSHVNQWIENRKGTLTPNVGKLFQKQRQAEELAKRGKQNA